MKKKTVTTEKKFQYKLTEFLSQFEMNAEMDISKNQWRSTGGMNLLQGMFVFVGKEIEILQ